MLRRNLSERERERTWTGLAVQNKRGVTSSKGRGYGQDLASTIIEAKLLQERELICEITVCSA